MKSISAFLMFLLFPLNTSIASDLMAPVSNTDISAFAVGGYSSLLIPGIQEQQLRAIRLQGFQQAAHEQGVQLGLANRRTEYISRFGDVYGKAALIEEIGEAGARSYARRAGYKPLYRGQAGSGKGFDQVYRNPKGNQIVVIEAKGGGSPLKTYHGHPQGSTKYILAVAENTLHSSTATKNAKKTAEEVLQAHKKGRLVSQVVRTEHVLGKPTTTTITTPAGKLNIPSPLEPVRMKASTGGAGGMILVGVLDLLAQAGTPGDINWNRNLTYAGLGMVANYGGVSSGGVVQKVLLQSRKTALTFALSRPAWATVASGMLGGTIASAIVAYGSFALGYGDLQAANRTMAIGLIGTSVGTMTGMATLAAIQALGTASTGAAISGLSGVAATNAAMAWLGGGSLAAGGGGVALGSVILTGGVVVMVVGVSAAVWYFLNYFDKQVEQERVAYLLKHLEAGIN